MKSDFLEKFKGKANRVSKEGYNDLFHGPQSSKSRLKSKSKSKSKSPNSKHHKQNKSTLKNQLKSKTHKQNRSLKKQKKNNKIAQSQKQMRVQNKDKIKAKIKKQNMEQIKQNINPHQKVKKVKINQPQVVKLPPISVRQNKLISEKLKIKQNVARLKQQQDKIRNYSFEGLNLDGEAFMQLQNLNKFAQRIQERCSYTKNRGTTLHY